MVPAALGLLLSGGPTIISPFPLLTVMPAFFLANLHLWPAGIVLPMLLFFVWNPGLFAGVSTVPKRSYVLLVAATLLDAFWFLAGWKWGLEYQGARHTQVVCIVNAAWIVFLGLSFVRSWKGGISFRYSLFLHWMLFAWLAWYAFPYLGELP